MLVDSADACGEDKLKEPGAVRREEGSAPSVAVATAALFTKFAEAKGGSVAVLPIDGGPGAEGGDRSALEASGKAVGTDDNVEGIEKFTDGNVKVGREPLTLGATGDRLGAEIRADELGGGCIGCEYCSVSTEESGLAPASGVIEGSAGIMLNAGDAEAAAAPSTCAAVSVNIPRLPFVEDDSVAE